MNKEDYIQKIAARIKQYRILNHMTQEQVAYSLSLTTQHYAQLERTRRRFTLDHILTLCELFNVSITDIIIGGSDTNDKIEEHHDNEKKLILDNISSLLSDSSYSDLLIVQRIVEDLVLLSH